MSAPCRGSSPLGGMKLVVLEASGKGAGLECVVTVFFSGLPVEIDRSPASVGPICQLLTPHGPLFSSIAICKYLLGLAEKQTSGSGKECTWKVDNCLHWVVTTLHPVLNGANVNDMRPLLNHLEERLILQKKHSGGEVKSLIEGASHLTLADIFVVCCVLKRFHLVGSNHRSLHNFISDCLTLPYFQSALNVLPSAGPVQPIPTYDEVQKQKFYLTTAINYTNGLPHIGHAYEAVTSDVLARYHRAFGRDVFFLTGTDEHGQKISREAEKKGVDTQEFCDFYAKAFQDLNTQLKVEQDFFVRTTTEVHHDACQELWKRSLANGDIYLGSYVGWYNMREETFVSERDAHEMDYKDPSTGVPLEEMKEESYFFRMSKYQDALIQHLKANPSFLQPAHRLNEILSRLKEPLEDLSISRTTFTWGIDVPGDKAHVMYVWFDALTNYLTGIDYFQKEAKPYWPPDVQIIGKDIIWFHCVIWPCMLMSAGIPLPKCIFAHGFIHAADGRKMSKSFGTVVNPYDILTQIPADSLRYFLIREARYGWDLKFDMTALIEAHNGDLADVIGNLVHRALGLTGKYCEGKVPNVSIPSGDCPFDVPRVLQEVEQFYQNFQLQEALELTIVACKDTNKYLTDRAPWSIKDNQQRQKVVRALLEAVYVLGHLLFPVLPETGDVICRRVGGVRRYISELSPWYDNLETGSTVTVGADILFKKIENEGTTAK